MTNRNKKTVLEKKEEELILKIVGAFEGPKYFKDFAMNLNRQENEFCGFGLREGKMNNFQGQTSNQNITNSYEYFVHPKILKNFETIVIGEKDRIPAIEGIDYQKGLIGYGHYRNRGISIVGYNQKFSLKHDFDFALPVPDGPSRWENITVTEFGLTPGNLEIMKVRDSELIIPLSYTLLDLLSEGAILTEKKRTKSDIPSKGGVYLSRRF